MRPYLVSILLVAMTTLNGCGGGGGGNDDTSFSGAATVSLDISPSTIDSGDETLVNMWIGDVSESGIALKVRFPTGLSYVYQSAQLVIGEKERALKPRNNVITKDGNYNYLVFYLSQALFQQASQDYNGEPGLVQLRLEGKSAVNDGLIEVDVDVDDPNVADSLEFSLTKPEFVAADQQSITVVEGD